MDSGLFEHRSEVMEAFEVGEMVGRHPVAQIRWKQQWGVAIDIYETSGHKLLKAYPMPTPRML